MKRVKLWNGRVYEVLEVAYCQHQQRFVALAREIGLADVGSFEQIVLEGASEVYPEPPEMPK